MCLVSFYLWSMMFLSWTTRWLEWLWLVSHLNYLLTLLKLWNLSRPWCREPPVSNLVSVKAHVLLGKFSAEKNFFKCDWPTQIFRRKKFWSWKFSIFNNDIFGKFSWVEWPSRGFDGGFDPNIKPVTFMWKESTLYRMSWDFSGCSGFLPQEMLTGWDGFSPLILPP
jgi:hypothetical protein